MPQSSAALRAKRETAARQRHAAQHVTPAPVQRTVRWATKPWPLPYGRVLAVRKTTQGDQLRLDVLVERRDGPLGQAIQRRWCPVTEVLSPHERALWARSGFGDRG